MMERSPVVLQELAGPDLITDLFVKIFPVAVARVQPHTAISRYMEDQPNTGYDKFFPELSDK